MNKKAQIRAPIQLKNTFILSHNPDRKLNNIEKKGTELQSYILIGENL